MRSTVKPIPQQNNLPLSGPWNDESEELAELKALFDSLEQPYGLAAIHQFNRAYQRIYGRLTKEEKLKAEALVDAMIAHVEKREFRCKIYGVV